ncbi:MAG: hypothetical protein LQ352_007131 [Teloschistes flavicans]|nr:MAG: hypothetical protein LQ352_007131 [Teloschistes flavicans]
MSLKRKRSCDTLFPSSTSSTPTSLSPSSRATTPVSFATTPTPARPDEPSLSRLHSRTRKRLRNNRPADAEVFGKTSSSFPPLYPESCRSAQSELTVENSHDLRPIVLRRRCWCSLSLSGRSQRCATHPTSRTPPIISAQFLVAPRATNVSRSGYACCRATSLDTCLRRLRDAHGDSG